MVTYPTTYGEFVEWFQDDESCYARLFQIRWPNGFICTGVREINTGWTNRGFIGVISAFLNHH
jgi:hypothetical protein